MVREVQDRIPHELARAVEGDVPAALHLEDLHAALAQRVRRKREAGLLRATAERDDGVVLHEQEEVLGQLAGLPGAAEPALELEHLTVRTAPEIVDQQRSIGHAPVRSRRTRRESAHAPAVASMAVSPRPSGPASWYTGASRRATTKVAKATTMLRPPRR